jgi:hypothetical protein
VRECRSRERVTDGLFSGEVLKASFLRNAMGVGSACLFSLFWAVADGGEAVSVGACSYWSGPCSPLARGCDIRWWDCG